ncbi:MAG TPA: AMP-binding protein, partial [Polyangia bacterium]|nr:AMP-binding protein [Polyangia bacterium]
FTTSAPLVYLALKGQNVLPVSQKLILDVVPVDHVVSGMLMVAAQACVEQPKLVHQLSSGDLNPLYIDRVTTLTGLYKRRRFQDKETGNRFLNELAARMEFRPVSEEAYEARSIPMFNRVVKRTSAALARIRPGWGAGRFTELLDRAKKNVDEMERVTDEAAKNIELFRPFIFENKYVFRADNVRALRDRFSADDQARLRWGPERLDWYDYWMNVHFPGLQRWVLPELDETYAARPKQIYSYHDLLELFDTTTKLHATRTALRIERGKREEIYSYADLQELAGRVGVFLLGEGVAAADRVMLYAKNGPEWSMAYFGILKVGGTAAPLGHESTVVEIVNVARASGAVGILIGDDLHEKRATLTRALREAELPTKVWPFAQAFELLDREVELERAKGLVRRSNPDAVASLIFTSGTTGKPKGVMLTHRNFTFMVAELSKVFEFGVSDGMLSVLPLHHTFEFSTGLLVPLAHGAQITYLSELTGDAIANTMKKGHVTAIVGVPALWDLMRRRVMSRFSEKSPLLETVMKGLMTANYELRSRTRLDLGLLFFLPVHEGFGGRIRYLISGGSALPSEVLKTFHGMGFNFFEGYGLTETAPVLTVTSPKSKPLLGSVGKPLSGLELKIDSPDGSGVGEVIARGRNVMAGYWEDSEATDAAIRDGWFHTGDLGRLDEDGNLYLVGRSKEIIVDSNGKNVYPDEIEDLYRESPYIKELSVVGLPDGAAEHVACAVAPNYETDTALSPAEVRARIDAHFRRVSADLPFWKRVKTIQIWEGELPHTSTRKVKRREVVAELQRLLGQSDGAGADIAADPAREAASAGWLLDIIATVSGRPRGELSFTARFDQLGFDSLMYAELGSALEAAGMPVPEGADVTAVADVAQLHVLLTRGRIGAGLGRGGRKSAGSGSGDDEIHVPSAVARAGKKGLALAQKLFYRRVLHTDVVGANHIPNHTNFIVAANHSSHLDMGLIKVALGEMGRDITSLAAADYFFRNKYRRAYFSNFTNLVAMERSGSIRRSMDTAEEVLRRGRSMVVFPEGTRSVTGAMADFLPSLGYLALRAEVGLLPAYVSGTYESLPKGAALPKGRKVGVAFGPFLSIELLKELTDGLAAQEAWRLVAAFTQRIVENLRNGVANAVDIAAARAAWKGQRLGPLHEPSKVGRRRSLRSVP